LTSYHEHNKWAKLDYLLNYLKEECVALVCNAGTPGISDPGYELIVASTQRGIPVIAIPGPSVVITSLAISGLPTDRFIYVGYLPHKTGGRRRLLESVADESGTIIALESPHRLLDALNDVRLILGDRRIAVCRELTKIHEEVFRARVSQAIDYFTQPRGEFTLIIEGKGEQPKPQLTEDVERQLKRMRQSGMTAKEAIGGVARETGIAKKTLYRAWLKIP